MPRLDRRLKTVAGCIRSSVHADVGSDHGHLLLALLRAGRIDRGIAIENKSQPFLNSQVALRDCKCDVRLGDGLEVLEAEEANSLSICGMGGLRIVGVLDRFPRRVPSTVVLQPNQRADLVRQWALRAGFRLVDEHRIDASRVFEVLEFMRHEVSGGSFDDPAYAGLDRSAALMFGPHHLRRREPHFLERLREEQSYYRGLDRLNDQTRDRLELIDRLL